MKRLGAMPRGWYRSSRARQAFAGLAVEAIRDEQQAGILAEHAPAPAPVEFAQAPADARAAGPVLDRVRDPRHRDIDVAVTAPLSP